MERGIRAGTTDTVLLGPPAPARPATVAWLAERLQRPVLVMPPNKTLAAQFANELRARCSRSNAVEYFVSYYDYYSQPEAYVPADRHLHREGTPRSTTRWDRLAALGHELAAHPPGHDRGGVRFPCIYGLGALQEYVDRMLKLR